MVVPSASTVSKVKCKVCLDMRREGKVVAEGAGRCYGTAEDGTH